MLQYLPTKLARPSRPRRANYMYCLDDIQVQIMFYSTFEPMVLPGGGPMEAMGVQKLSASISAHTACGLIFDQPVSAREKQVEDTMCIFFLLVGPLEFNSIVNLGSEL